ncbi:hypothetical protein [uncultured Faecalibaculum sp.]|uniref:hypothetical protein n=1 Tax=uncultured Faecalibaculum sp. TaxID=1729681 RepID=UPI0025F4FDDC|nr:hypothetical protein [uncultured Faecalibaculum sp.]
MMCKSSHVLRRCDCQCCALLVEKQQYPGEDPQYNLSIVDSYYDPGPGSLRSRIRNAWKVLTGKRVYYNDLFMQDPADFQSLVRELQELAEAEL